MDNQKEIVLDKNFFEHLLNCMANQRFIASLSEEEKEVNQSIIDKAWNKGMFILNLDGCKKRLQDGLLDRAQVYWNSRIKDIQVFIEEESKDVLENEKSTIMFKWTQLVWQEIWMWCLLCGDKDSIVDMDKCSLTTGQVSTQDFNDIATRRGFNDNKTKLLKDALIFIGIGELLKDAPINNIPDSTIVEY